MKEFKAKNWGTRQLKEYTIGIRKLCLILPGKGSIAQQELFKELVQIAKEKGDNNGNT